MEVSQVKVVCDEDCGNAPKKVLIRDFITAIARGDQDFVQGNVTNEIVWEVVGKAKIKGVEVYLESLSQHPLQEPNRKDVVIRNIITHGNVASANGTISANKKIVDFCEVYHFSGFKNAKIKAITSYIIYSEG